MQRPILYLLFLLFFFSGPAAPARQHDADTLSGTFVDRLYYEYSGGTIKQLVYDGEQLIKEGAYDEALTLLQRGVSLSGTQEKGKAYLPAIYNYIGAIYIFKGQYEQATRNFFLSIAYSHEAEDSVYHIAKAYNNLSVTFNRLVRNDKALYYLDKVEELATRHRLNGLLPGVWINKGRIYKENKDWAQAEINFSKALRSADTATTASQQYFTVTSAQEIKQIALLNMAQLCYDRKQFNAALGYITRCLKAPGLSNPYYQVATLLTAGRINYQLKQYSQAEQYLLEGLQKSEHAATADGLYEGYKTLSLVYAATGKFQQAYHYQLRANTAEDSLRNAEKVKAVETLEIKYRTAQKDKELAEKELNISRQNQQLRKKNLWILFLLAGAGFLGLIVYSRYHSIRQKQLLQEQKVLTLEKEQKLQMLNAHIEGEEMERSRMAHTLHDGVGSLISAVKMNVSALQILPEERYIYLKAIDLLNDASFELRSTAHNLMPEMVLQEGLQSAVRLFCDRVSNHKSLFIECQFYGDFRPMKKTFELFIYRLTQELVNNAIKHAEAGRILVQLSMHNDLLTLTVEDNGKGFAMGALPKGGGLNNIKEKTGILGGSMSIQSGEGTGTQIYLEFNNIEYINDPSFL